jgi:aquaporin Z
MTGRARFHWPEYLMEAAGLGLFMISAGLFGTLLEHPLSPVGETITDAMSRRLLMGLAMGLTAVGIVYSPWGQRSGAHINPAVTLTFWRLGKVAGRDALFYVISQFAGGLAGVLVVAGVLGSTFTRPPIAAVATVGQYGAGVAFLAETLISFLTMTVILAVSNSRRWARWTGVLAGCLIAIYITFEAPLSGFSQNPARTFASALPGGVWTDIWVYFTAPLVGMFAAAEVFLALRGPSAVACAKLHHANRHRCIFCEFQHQHRPLRNSPSSVQESELVTK